MDIAKIIGNNLKEYREKIGYTQDHIAGLLGVDRSTISHYETAEREISMLHLQHYSDLFGVDIQDLIEESKETHKANLAFAFRSEGIKQEDIQSIASFQKVVKNYIKMKHLANEQA